MARPWQLTLSARPPARRGSPAPPPRAVATPVSCPCSARGLGAAVPARPPWLGAPPPRVRAAPCPGVVARLGPAGHGAPARPLLQPWCGSASSAPARCPACALAPARCPTALAPAPAPPQRAAMAPARPRSLPPPRLRCPSPRRTRCGALRSPARRAVPAARPPRRALPLPGAATTCRPRRGLELGPACLWHAALSSASVRPRAFGLGVAPLPLAARARLGPGVCASRPRRVNAALRARVLACACD
eukprot:XP_020393654.1 basic proline-rich protein-like [Zea mays]